jgi:hypothetical protein
MLDGKYFWRCEQFPTHSQRRPDDGRKPHGKPGSVRGATRAWSLP